MAKRMYSFRLDEDLVTQVDRARGDVPRTRFIQRALEAALSEAKGRSLGEQADPSPVPSVEGVRSAAPPRAPVHRSSAALDRQAKLNAARGKR